MTITWVGKSGAEYPFNLDSLAAAYLDVPGVYILCREYQDGNVTRLKALYVGEAESLEDRLDARRSDHDGFKRAAKMGITHICSMRVDGGVQARLRIETDLRHAYNPPCNQQGVPSLGDILAGR